MSDQKTEPKIEFVRINVKGDTKREIDILAASEQRTVYEIVEDMLKVYKAVTVGKSPRSKSKTPVSIAEVISTH